MDNNNNNYKDTNNSNNGENNNNNKNKRIPDDDEPIYSPPYPGPEYAHEPDWEKPVNSVVTFSRFWADLVRKPVHWIRENIVEANRGPKYYWYHRKFERALPIDECYLDDLVCLHEANQEYLRTHLVDRAALDLLRYRRDSCYYWNSINNGFLFMPHDNCKHLSDTFDREEDNFLLKYGDLPWFHNVSHAYNKQKHRMIMNRRREALGLKIEGRGDEFTPKTE